MGSKQLAHTAVLYVLLTPTNQEGACVVGWDVGAGVGGAGGAVGRASGPAAGREWEEAGVGAWVVGVSCWVGVRDLTGVESPAQASTSMR